MNFAPDITADAILIDGTETVMLHGASSVTVEGARRGALTLPEVEFRQVGVESTDLAWNLPGVSLAGVAPRRGDSIEDAGGAHWTILSATHSPLTDVWRLVTRKHV
jgi:hypothetical protein